MKRQLTILFMLMGIVLAAFAQEEITVKGQVTDPTG